MFEEFSMHENHYELEELDYKENKFQRLAYGVGDVDVWSFDGYLMGVIHNGLLKLAKNTHGWPESDEYPEFDDWIKALNEMAAKARWILEYSDISDGIVEYYLGNLEMEYRDRTDNFVSVHIYGDKETEQSREDYAIAIKALQERRDQIKTELFEWLSKWFDALWD